MSLFDYFSRKKKKQESPASMAKERLQIIVAHERGQRSQPDYLPQLQQEIIDVISKYVPIDREQVHVALDNQDDCSILELNITLPDR